MHGIVSSGLRNEDEGLYPVQHGYWLRTLRRAVTSNPTEH
jgi:benzoate/toluate 1,2-dioxygenase alpha subunit